MGELENMDKLKEEYNAIPTELCVKISKHLYKKGNTRVAPSAEEIIKYYKENYPNKKS